MVVSSPETPVDLVEFSYLDALSSAVCRPKAGCERKGVYVLTNP